MIKFDIKPTKARVNLGGRLLILVLFLLFQTSLYLFQTSLYINLPAPLEISFLRPVPRQTAVGPRVGMLGLPRGEGFMASRSNRRYVSLSSKRVNLTFEQLEPRHLFSGSPPEPPMLEHMFAPPPLDHMNTPPVLDSNHVPIVYAGADITVNILDGAVISGELIVNQPKNLSVSWSKITGPGSVTFSEPASPSTSATFSEAGQYELELIALNGDAVASDRVVVNVLATEDVINIDQAWLDSQGDGPYYLDQQGKTYVLQTDVTTDGTAFAITASNVTFDLNGYKITYDNAAPIEIPNGSFEFGTGVGADGWELSNAPGAGRHQGVWLHNEVYEGQYSLRFEDTTTNQHATSTATVTLKANTTYSLSAMFEYGGQGENANPGVNGYVRLVGVADEPVREVSWNSSNWRGIQLREGTFTTGAADETYTIQAGIDGTPTSTKPFYIDDIKIQRTKVYGIAGSAYEWAASEYPGIENWGKSSNATIKNGTVVQGANGSTWAHGVLLHTVGGVTIQNLDITVHGANSSAIAGKSQDSFTTSVFDNNLTSNVQTITSRDNFHGAVISWLQGDIRNNTIHNGPHAGIVTGTSIASNVHGNVIQLKARYTNGFGIRATAGSQIHHNTINCGTGEYAARGIMIYDGSVDTVTEVYSNEVHVQLLSNSQEYEGDPLGGAYGIQVENGKNVVVRNNDVTAYGNTVEAYAFRMNSDGGSSDSIHVHHNTFRAVATGDRAATIKLSGVSADTVSFEDNTLITNDGLVGGTANSTVSLVRSSVIVDAPVADPYVMSADYSNQPDHTSISFIDTSFANAESKSYLEDATAREIPRYGGDPDPKMAFESRWTTSLVFLDSNGTPISDVNVTIKDNTATTIASGASDANGLFSCVLTQFRTTGDTNENLSSYTLTANYNGQETQHFFDVEQLQQIEIVLGEPVLDSLLQNSSGTIVLSAENASNTSLTTHSEWLPNILTSDYSGSKVESSTNDVLDTYYEVSYDLERGPDAFLAVEKEGHSDHLDTKTTSRGIQVHELDLELFDNFYSNFGTEIKHS